MRARPGAGTRRQGAGARLLHFYLRGHFLRPLEGAVERVYPLLVLVCDLRAASLQCMQSALSYMPSFRSLRAPGYAQANLLHGVSA